MYAKRRLILITAIICFLIINLTATTALADPVRVSGVRLDQGEIILFLGHDEVINATVYPANADNRSVRWEVADSRIVEIIPDGRRVRVIARAAGETNVTVITNDRGFQVSCLITVIIPVRSIGINYETITVEPGETFELQAILVPGDATEQGIVWESSNPAVASVDQQGKVKGVTLGDARIIARSAYDERNIFAYTNVAVAVEAEAPVVSEEITGDTEDNQPPVIIIEEEMPQPGSDNMLVYGLIGLAAALIIAAFILVTRGRRQVSGLAPVAHPASPVQTAQAYLTGLSGPFAGRRFNLNQGPAVIGRDPAQANVLYPQDITEISRRHVTVSFDPAGQTFILEDTSSNGTFLAGGERLQQHQPYYLQAGATFTLGQGGDTYSVELE
jgi:hypothetical protein